MKRFISRIICLAFVVLLSSCVPVIKVSSIPKGADQAVPEGFAKDDDKILVLPVWEKSPVYQDRSSSTINPLGSPDIIYGRELSRLHEKISGPIAAAFLGADFGIGRNVFFHTIYLISESGQAVHLRRYGDIFKKNLSAFTWLGLSWREELRKDFSGDNETGNARFWAENTVRINYSSGNRDVVMKFLELLPSIPSDKKRWEDEWF